MLRCSEYTLDAVDPQLFKYLYSPIDLNAEFCPNTLIEQSFTLTGMPNYSNRMVTFAIQIIEAFE